MPFAGICNRFHSCLNLSLQQPAILAPPFETTSLEESPGVAAWPTRPEGDKLLDHLHLSILLWDESILETLSPQLTIGADSSGRTGRGCCFLCLFERLKGLLSCVLGRMVRPPRGGNGQSDWVLGPPPLSTGALLSLPSHGDMARGTQTPAEPILS